MNTLARQCILLGLVGAMALGLWPGGWSALEAAAPAGPASAEPAGAVLAAAEGAVQEGDLEAAAELYRAAAAAEQPATALPVRLGLAACQLRLGQLAAAETTLLSLTVSDLPADPTLGGQIPAELGRKMLGRAYRWLAEVHQRRQDYSHALTLLLRGLLTSPGPSAMREAGEQACLYSYPEALQAEYETLLGEDAPTEEWRRAHEAYFLAYEGALAAAREALEERLREDPDSPLAGAFWAKLGEVAKREGDPARAVECYEKALARAEGLGDEFAVARLHLGYLYEQVGRTEEAQKQFDRILERSPLEKPAVGAAVELANLHRTKKRFEAAWQSLAWLEAHFPENELGALRQAAEGRARVFLAQGDYARGEEALWNLAARFPQGRSTAAQLLVDLAERRVEEGPSEEAQRLLERVQAELADQQEQVVRARVIQGRAWAKAGEEEKAREVWQRLLEERSESPWAATAALELAQWHRQRQEYAEEVAAYRWAFEHHPDSEAGQRAAQEWPARLIEAEQEKEATAALEEVQARLVHHPQAVAEALVAAGDACCRRGLVDEGQRLYRQVESQFGGRPALAEVCARAWLHLGESFRTKGQAEEARAVLEELQAKYPETWEAGAAGLHLGRYHAQQGEREKAAEVMAATAERFRQIIWIAAPAWEQMGEMWETAGVFDRAEEAFRRVLQGYPGEGARCARAHLRLGRLYEKQQRHEEAEAQFQAAKAALENHPTEEAAAAGIELASLYRSLGRYEEALAALDWVEERFAGAFWRERVAEGKTAVLLAKGDLAACEAALQRMLEAYPTSRPWVALRLVKLGDAYHQRGERDQAIAFYRKVGQEFIEQEEAWARAVAKLAVLGENEAVAELTGQSPRGKEKVRSGIAREKVEWAYQLEEEGWADEAIQVCQEVLREFPEERESCARALLYWAFSLGARKGLYLEGARKCEEVVREYPEQKDWVAVALLEKGYFLWAAGRLDEAEEVLAQLTQEKLPGVWWEIWAKGLWFRALCRLDQRDLPQAQELLRELLREFPESVKASEARTLLADLERPATMDLVQELPQREPSQVLLSTEFESEVLQRWLQEGWARLKERDVTGATQRWEKVRTTARFETMISVTEQSARIARRLSELEATYGGTPLGRQCLVLVRDFLWARVEKCARAQNDWPLWASNLREVDEWLALPSLEDLGGALVRRCYVGGQYGQAVGLARSILAAGLENRYAAGDLNRYLGLCLEEMDDCQAALVAYRQASQFYEKADPERAAAMQYQVIRLCYRLGDAEAARAEQEKLLAQFGDSEYAKLLRQGQLPIPASSEAEQISIGRR